MANSSVMHTRKKQFQTPITSFFPRESADDVRRTLHTPSLAPALPAATQAGLISVGMRVRKSVPEGYKTHKTIGQAASSSMPPSAIKIRSEPTVTGSQELMPFCGLHKIGGLGMQQMPASSAPAAVMDTYELDFEHMPDLSGSQITLSSSQESFGPVEEPSNRKRTYEDEVEDGMDALFEDMHAPDIIHHQMPGVSRPIAKPRNLRKTAISDQPAVINPGDFDEAPFLTPMEVVD
ncbi:uncharacterized protein K489DRAFT_373103 [Dissoconium aciculare CBS 342.82]|uniref:Uncharacterized protein n=1 Tax=Dissoconium aciculare CBS 342.82 TaxID=1314786 RepID=A0A6J3LZ15_9PEZI|nr:uncharacterized protein K489DRAFT_373103 [Dissoconium aciculare CBS 342.82]KAF1819877.1 hypothetical protein K489DRAFT_373103 [Dissoconium aciculare CBS 342.82]